MWLSVPFNQKLKIVSLTPTLHIAEYMADL